jgi:hypothetical protein
LYITPPLQAASHREIKRVDLRLVPIQISDDIRIKVTGEFGAYRNVWNEKDLRGLGVVAGI